MEFPETGSQCNVKECKILDFLPIQCAYCQLNFCKDHSLASSHECKKCKVNIVTEKKVTSTFKCSMKECTKLDAVEMNCVICKKHFCLRHRHHGCLDIGPSLGKKEKLRNLREKFKEAKENTDKLVQNTLRNASNRVLANKIKLMKIKGSAVGDNQIPIKDRIFFLVAPPLQGNEKSTARGVFVNKNWTVGKVIDSFSKRLKVNNKNDEADSPKLRLFSLDGDIIAKDMAIIIQTFLESNVIVDGDSIILEYVNQKDLDGDNYAKIFDKSKCSKYIFI